jgi:adenine-specific DNA-methyltransferase
LKEICKQHQRWINTVKQFGIEDYAEDITANRIKKAIRGYEFSGNKRTVLKSYSLNLTNLKKSKKIIDEFEVYKSSEKYSNVTLESDNGNIAIIGEEYISGMTEGTGGNFDFYELGEPIFNEDQNLNEEVGEQKIREYIYYTETKQHLEREQLPEYKYLLDTYNNTGYYFYYEKDKFTTLSLETLNIVTEKAEQYLIYADHCLLDKDYMMARNIIFKKIPRDIKRF